MLFNYLKSHGEMFKDCQNIVNEINQKYVHRVDQLSEQALCF